MEKHRLVVFVGAIGAGKSTQKKLLALELRKKGFKVRTVYIRTNHLLAHLLSLTLTRLFIKKRKSPKRAHVRALIEERPVAFRHIFKLWLALDLLSISFRFLLTVFVPAKIGYTVLVEDHLLTSIVDHKYYSKALDLPYEASSFAPRFLLKLIHVAGPATYVYLDAENDSLKARQKKRGRIEKTDFSQMQRNTLLLLLKAISSCESLYIDTTNQNLMETCELIESHLTKPG